MSCNIISLVLRRTSTTIFSRIQVSRLLSTPPPVLSQRSCSCNIVYLEPVEAYYIHMQKERNSRLHSRFLLRFQYWPIPNFIRSLLVSNVNYVQFNHIRFPPFTLSYPTVQSTAKIHSGMSAPSMLVCELCCPFEFYLHSEPLPKRKINSTPPSLNLSPLYNTPNQITPSLPSHDIAKKIRYEKKENTLHTYIHTYLLKICIIYINWFFLEASSYRSNNSALLFSDG